MDGQVVAWGDYWHEPKSRQIHFALYVVPAWQETAIPAQMHRYLLTEIEKLQPRKIASEPKEDETFRAKLLTDDGFQFLMRFPRSALDVNQVKLADYEPVLASVQQQGIRFVTLTDVMAADPDWQHNIWQLFAQIERDIPTPHPEEPTPFDEYANYYEGEDFRPDSWAIAVDETAGYVGMCVVNVMRKRPHGLFAGITGVIRSHRRRKIATALKLCSIRYAQENGFTTIYTDNEENNPMFQLNLELGFKPLPAWAFYEKSFV
jgi:GNAT superfamily N-acetyltransferase